jgi:hypothetical protein
MMARQTDHIHSRDWLKVVLLETGWNGKPGIVPPVEGI